MKYQPFQMVQTSKRVWANKVDAAVVEGQPSEVLESPERIVRYLVELRHRELYPLCLAGYLVEVFQVAMSAGVGDRSTVRHLQSALCCICSSLGQLGRPTPRAESDTSPSSYSKLAALPAGTY